MSSLIKLTLLSFLLVAAPLRLAADEPSVDEVAAFTDRCAEAIEKRFAVQVSSDSLQIGMLKREPATYASMWGLEVQEKHIFHLQQSAEARAAHELFKPEDFDVISGIFLYHAGKAATCSVRVYKGEEFGSNHLVDADVMIDGFTYSEWLMAEIAHVTP